MISIPKNNTAVIGEANSLFSELHANLERRKSNAQTKEQVPTPTRVHSTTVLKKDSGAQYQNHITSSLLASPAFRNRRKATRADSSSESDSEDENTYTNNKSVTVDQNNPKYDISGIPTPPSSPERGRVTQTKGDSADISHLAQAPISKDTGPIPMPPSPPPLPPVNSILPAVSSKNSLTTDLLQEIRQVNGKPQLTRRASNITSSSKGDKTASTHDKKFHTEPTRGKSKIRPPLEGFWKSLDQAISPAIPQKPSTTELTEEELLAALEWADPTPTTYEVVHAPPIWTGKISTLNKPEAFFVHPLPVPVKPMADAVQPIEPKIEEVPLLESPVSTPKPIIYTTETLSQTTTPNIPVVDMDLASNSINSISPAKLPSGRKLEEDDGPKTATYLGAPQDLSLESLSKLPVEVELNKESNLSPTASIELVEPVNPPTNLHRKKRAKTNPENSDSTTLPSPVKDPRHPAVMLNVTTNDAEQGASNAENSREDTIATTNLPPRTAPTLLDPLPPSILSRGSDSPLASGEGSDSGGGEGRKDSPPLPAIVANYPNTNPQTISQLVEDSMFTIGNIITHEAQNRLFAAYNTAAIGSGEEDNSVPKNLWINGNYGISKYDDGTNNRGNYKGRTTVGSIGADIEVRENSIIGLAYNYVRSNFHYKSHRDKVAINTHLLSLYGQGNLTEKLILQGFFSLGFGDIYTTTPFQNQLLKNKIKNKPCSSKVVLAHKSRVGKLVVIPNMAFKYGSYNTGSYTQNFEAQSLSVASNNNKKTSGVIGVGTTLPLQITNTTLLTPGLYVEAEKFFRNKASIFNVTTSSLTAAPTSQLLFAQRPPKYSYKIGGNVTIKHGITEIMTTYDYLATDKKYFSHQGSIKLNLLF
ncbi:autotransporter domain-containing protein [Candidatus Tisiphia endosymbiont of Nemotelus uliginosus]|uniref:autotransporter outer membrane beta-barrel domain-containing protein n=1 Tax=Candidatus Tisiphia endosymbiont of Nemotelus uliginosus TaxID=3077926 RepID=UPI0035C8A023